MDAHNVNAMAKTLSDYDLFKMQCDERQAIIDVLTATIAQKDAEIERLRVGIAHIIENHYPGFMCRDKLTELLNSANNWTR